VILNHHGTVVKEQARWYNFLLDEMTIEALAARDGRWLYSKLARGRGEEVTSRNCNPACS
jgi:hypothetical protein